MLNGAGILHGPDSCLGRHSDLSIRARELPPIESALRYFHTCSSSDTAELKVNCRVQETWGRPAAPYNRSTAVMHGWHFLRRHGEDGLTGVSTGWCDEMGAISGKLPETAVISRFLLASPALTTNHTLCPAAVARKVWGQNLTWLRNSCKVVLVVVVVVV